MVYSQRSYHQLPMITMKVTAALPLHLFSVVSHSSLHLSYFDHTVQTLQTPFMPTQVPTSLSSRCNKLLPFSGSYIYLIFFVQLTSPKSPITAGSGSTPPKYLQDYILSSLLGLCELWDNLLLNVLIFLGYFCSFVCWKKVMLQWALLGEQVLFLLLLFFHALAGHIILTELLPLNHNCSLFTGHLCLIPGGGYSWTLMSN